MANTSTKICFLSLGLSGLLLFAGFSQATSLTSRFNEKLFVKRPPIYLPEEKSSHLLAFGHSTMLGKVLWFNLLNYFGKEYGGDRDYQWLSHMCNVVTNLDPKAAHVYKLCATLLAWEVKETKASNAILDRAQVEFPEDWYFIYLKGFNKWYFEEDLATAAKYFERAAKQPEAPEFLSSLASKLMVSTGQASSAINFLSEAINNTRSPAARESLTEKLRQAILRRDIDFLEEAARRYEQKYQKKIGGLDELVSGKIITKLPSEPFGGKYILNNGNVETTSGKEPLQFTGKTARTGAMKNEFTGTE